MELQMVENESGCCACDSQSEELAGYTTCADKKYVFTKREQEVLEKIRAASMRARAIKDQIRGLDQSSQEESLRELDQLRKMRAELERERVAAAEERMRLLGHV
jgi:uncharacterized protein involved in exopolysaccharide biosynthesis